MPEDKEMPSIVIANPWDIRKLIGWHIEDANILPGATVELVISHMMATSKVVVRFTPKATFSTSDGMRIQGGTPLLVDFVMNIMTGNKKEG